VKLTEVTRPQDAGARFGVVTISSVDDPEIQGWTFEDGMVRVEWKPDLGRAFSFRLTNKTEHALRIPWDGAAWVDERNESHRVLHGVVTYGNRDLPQAPTTVVSGTSVTDALYVADGWYRGPQGLTHRAVITPPPGSAWAGNVLTYRRPLDDAAADALRRRVAKDQGLEVRALLPLEIQGVTNDYASTFTLTPTLSLVPRRVGPLPRSPFLFVAAGAVVGAVAIALSD